MPKLPSGEHLLVADDADEWVAKCLELFNSPAQFERLGRAGRDMVLQEYSLDGMAYIIRTSIDRIDKATTTI